MEIIKIIPYQGGKVYGPYIRKGDGRSHIVLDEERKLVHIVPNLVKELFITKLFAWMVELEIH